MGRKIEVRRRVYEFLCIYKAENDGNAPTYEEIAQSFHWASPTTAWWHVDRLEREGLVQLDEKRRIVLVNGEYIPPNSENRE